MKTFFVGEQVSLTGTIVDARDAGNIAVKIGDKIVHVSARSLSELEPKTTETLVKSEAEVEAPKRRRYRKSKDEAEPVEIPEEQQ